MVRIADIHHHLGARALFISNLTSIDREFNQAIVNISVCSLGAGHGYLSSTLQDLGRVARSHNARQTEFTTDDCAMASTTAAVGDDCRSPLHDWLPRGISHRRHQHIAGFEFSQMVGIGQHMNSTVTNPFAYCDAGYQGCAVFTR
jgi:hypothetical protein